jgi:predicted RNA-binding protein YlqC (UPF0109 family)
VKELVELLARALVRDEAAVSVTASEQGTEVAIELKVAPDDKGRVIGRHGKTARSLRTLLSATAARQGKTATLQISE